MAKHIQKLELASADDSTSPCERSPCEKSLCEKLDWRDPLSGRKLIPVITAKNPSGVPLSGAMRIEGTECGYPIVDSVIRLLPDLAYQYREWLAIVGLSPPVELEPHQSLVSVDSFGFQWTLAHTMRTQKDLEWRVCTRYGIEPKFLKDNIVLDAGAGAGDQSIFMLKAGSSVVSIDLSSSIDVVAKKCRMFPNWCGVQGDITQLPFAESQFKMIYCEGVIQHTQDSKVTVNELLRTLAPGGTIIATHYQKAKRTLGIIREGWVVFLRKIFARLGQWGSLLLAGIFAALAHVPLFGQIFVKTGTAIRYDLMPDFKTTWINTYDNLGPHSFQRYLSEEEFLEFFQERPGLTIEWNQGTTVRAKKCQSIL